MATAAEQTYVDAYRGSFTSMMRWPDLDQFWDTLRAQADDDWYIYAVGEASPTQTAKKADLLSFISEVDLLLHREHDEDYCGIVYADDKDKPGFIKIFDPNNLGVSCGFSEKPPLPGWIISRLQPIDLEPTLYPKNRQRWWQKIFTKKAVLNLS